MSDTLDQNHDSLEFDALAELFLGDAGHANGHRRPPQGPPEHHASDERSGDVVGSIGSTRPGPPPAPSIEVLVMGHLPVRTGPWLAQYAASAAARDGRPVALLRINQGEARIDLLGSRDAPRPARLDSLEEAIDVAATRTTRWMIQVGDLDVPWLLGSPLVDTLTLLAGGNEAALVDAYRTIKSLVAGSGAHEPEPARDDGSDRVPAIRLAIMGADDDRARSVADRLRDASRAFLAREIELAPGVGEMGPTNAVPLFRGPMHSDIRAILADLRERSRTRQTPAHADDAPAQPAPSPRERPEPARTSRGPSPDRSTRDSVDAPVSRSPSGNTEDPLPLASHVDGLFPLVIPYPEDETVHFAIDDHARLHVLRTDAESNGAGVSALTAAGAWATRHLDLINMAIGQRGPIRSDQPPALHLFTRRPAEVRALLDAHVRLHALAPVRPDRDFVSLDLN